MKKEKKIIKDLSELNDALSNNIVFQPVKKEKKAIKDLSELNDALSSNIILQPIKKEKTAIKDLSELGNALSKVEYQKLWEEKKSNWREQVARKNRRWLKENEKSELKQYLPQPKVYEKIKSYVMDDKKRGYMIHIITNFLPLNNTKQVILFREENPTCPFTNYLLTDTSGLMIGNRDRHIAFSGINTNVFLSGLAIQELYRFVKDCINDFTSKEGQIINFALDEIRMKSENNNEEKQ